MTQNKKTKAPVEALRKGLQILELLNADWRREGIPLAQIAQQMGQNKTTVHNLLKTLVICGFAENNDGIYTTGWKVRRLAKEQLAGDIANQNQKWIGALAVLSDKIEEPLVLASLIQGRRQVIARVESTQSVQVNSKFCEQNDMTTWETVTGRVLAAYALEQEKLQLFETDGIPGRRWNGLSTIEETLEELDRIKANGIAIDAEGEVFSAAVPIMTPDGSVFAALGVYLPMFRISPYRRSTILKLLKEGAQTLASLIRNN